MSSKPGIEDLDSWVHVGGGRHEEINPDLIALVARASGSIAVVQARGTVPGRQARTHSALYGRNRRTTRFTDELAERLPEAAPLLQTGDVWQPMIQMGPYDQGLNVDLIYQTLARNDLVIPTFRVRLNATTGEALVHCHRDAPIDGPDTDVVDVQGMLEALDLDVQAIQADNRIEYPASPILSHTLISAN